MELLGVITTDDHGESVFKTERFGDGEVKALGVLLLDALVNRSGIPRGRFVEDGVEGCAGVFDVQIDLAGLHGFVYEEGTAQIGFALYVDAGASFDVLGQELGEDDLFGEKLRADDNARFLLGVAGGEKSDGKKNGKERAHSRIQFLMRRRKEEGVSVVFRAQGPMRSVDAALLFFVAREILYDAKTPFDESQKEVSQDR